MTHVQCFVFMKTLKTNSQKNVNTYLVWRQPLPFVFVFIKRKQNNYQYQYTFGRLFTR